MRTPLRILLAPALAILLAVASCASGPVPLEDQQLTTLGTNAELGPVKLRNVYVQRPTDGTRGHGDSGRVLLTLVNEAPRQERLTNVTSSHARTVHMRWDRECDGTAEPVEALPLTANGLVPGPADRDVTGHLPYYLEISEFTEPAPTGTTVPITFTFDHAGEITVPAKVEPVGPADEAARYACIDIETG